MKRLWSKSRELLDFIPQGLRTDYWIVIVKRRSWPKWIFLALFLFLLTGLGSGYLGYWYMFKYDGCFFNLGCLTDDNGQPLDLEKLARAEFKKASYVYANNGEETGKYFDEIRDPVRLDDVPKRLQDAFLAAEDKRFYQHFGIDKYAIASAFIGNTTHALGWKFWTRSGGASTVTQQLARLEFADEVTDFKTRAYTLNRKLKEARLAIRLEKHYSKKEILETYLNLIWLGHGANGVISGSMRYWGKDIRKEDLTIKEAAILASINKNPTVYDPIFRKPLEPKIDKDTPPEQAVRLQEEYETKLTKEAVRLAMAKDRYNFVLEQMKYNGAISQEEYEENLFQKDKNPNTEELARLHTWRNPAYGYSNRMVKELLMSRGYSEETLSHYGGFRIYTTLDPILQRIASEEFEKHLVLLNQGKNPEDRINGAFIMIDVKTGNIVSLSGGNDFNETEYNRVMASRSPGSGFKPFTYAAAIEYLHKDFFDTICNCPFRMRGANGKAWAPQNFHEDNPVPYGYIPLSTGLIRSVNLPTLNLAREIGMKPIVQLANDMGVHGNPGMVRDSDGEIWLKQPGFELKGGLVPLLPTAIGASDVNLLELANAYTVFFREGMYIKPTLIREIKSTYGEETIFRAELPTGKVVLSEDTSNKMLALMRAVTKIGTAKISMRDIEQQVACKTGTSDGPRDVSIWCGTPELVIAVRFGLDDYRVVELPEYMAKASGRADMQVTGGWVAGPLVRKIIDRIYAERQQVEFSPAVETELQRLLDH